MMCAGLLPSRDRVATAHHSPDNRGNAEMSLAQLFELPRNEAEWAMWSFAPSATGIAITWPSVRAIAPIKN